MMSAFMYAHGLNKHRRRDWYNNNASEHWWSLKAKADLERDVCVDVHPLSHPIPYGPIPSNNMIFAHEVSMAAVEQ